MDRARKRAARGAAMARPGNPDRAARSSTQCRSTVAQPVKERDYEATTQPQSRTNIQ